MTPEALAAWKQDGVGLVIVQAFPTTSTGKHANQQQQIAQCRAAGLQVECYIYDYLASPDWRDGCIAGLAGSGIERVWADEEDVSQPAKVMSAGKRIQAMAHTLAAIEAAGFQTGIYTGVWWWSPYTLNTSVFHQFSLWVAHYDNVPDASVFTPFGGWTVCAIKQYAGTSVLHGVTGIDLDVTA